MTDRRNGNGRHDSDRTLARIEEAVKRIDNRLDDFVTRAEFQPVKAVAYGMVSLLMGGMVYLIIAAL